MEEAPPSEISVTMAVQAEPEKVEETLNNNGHDKNQASGEAASESESGALTATESAANTSQNAAETSAPVSDADHEKTLEYADELMEEGYKAMKENDFSEAAENFSRALEIRLSLCCFSFSLVAAKFHSLLFLWNSVSIETAGNKINS